MDDQFEWDGRKARLNRLKHGIDFADAATIFDDPHAISVRDLEDSEPRFVTLGMDALGRVLAVTYTWRGSHIRIISARKATRREAGTYGEKT